MSDNLFIVNFDVAVAGLQRHLSREDLPTIDIDQVKWRVCEIFRHIDPPKHLERIADEMIAHDYLYSKVEFIYTTVEDAKEEERQLKAYLRAGIVEFGTQMLRAMTELGLFERGTERYEVISRPIDHDTYILQRTRT